MELGDSSSSCGDCGALGFIPKNQQSVADEDLNNPSGGRCVRECCFLQ